MCSLAKYYLLVSDNRRLSAAVICGLCFAVKLMGYDIGRLRFS